MITPDYIFDQIAKCQNNYSEFDYKAHKEIEEYNKNLPNGGLKGTFIFDEFVMEKLKMCDMYVRLYARGNCRPMTTIISYFMMVESLKDMHDPLFNKYYKGAAEPLYFPPAICDKNVLDSTIPKPYILSPIDNELPDWIKECDPSLSGKLSGINVKKDW